MDEKILIKSEADIRGKKILGICPIVCFIIAVVVTVFFYIPALEVVRRYGKEFTEWSYWGVRWSYAFEEGDAFHLFIFIVGALCLLMSIIIGITYFINRKCELAVTESNVKGKTLFGKEVVLPLYMVSAYSTRKLLSVISVTTASGITKFSLIKNYQEIGNVLAQKINERQKNTVASAPVVAPAVQTTDSADQLKKFKDLLDSGVITQEEFDAKKKQLLGL